MFLAFAGFSAIYGGITKNIYYIAGKDEKPDPKDDLALQFMLLFSVDVLLDLLHSEETAAYFQLNKKTYIIT